MKSKVFIYAWNEHSEGAKAFAKELGIKRIRHYGSHFVAKSWKTVINWGSKNVPCRSPNHADWPKILNPEQVVVIAQDKLKFFQWMSNELIGVDIPNPPRIPKWTTNQQEAAQWIQQKKKVVCRTVLNGHSGNGIVIASNVGDLVMAPLYVEYVPKAAEYRIHIVKGEVIDVQRKIRDPDREPSNWEVRSHANGFIFVRGNVVAPADVIEQSRLAFAASGLDFGAVDCIWNDKQQKAYVLEINTAPGLEGQTVKNYAEAFRKLFT